MKENLWGIDLGGTKVEGAILKSAGDPDVLFRDRLPTLVLGMLEEGEFTSQDIDAIKAALKKVKSQET